MNKPTRDYETGNYDFDPKYENIEEAILTLEDGTIEYRRYGYLHREGQKPAVEHPDNPFYSRYYVDGELHNNNNWAAWSFRRQEPIYSFKGRIVKSKRGLKNTVSRERNKIFNLL